ncbi:MAG: anthranilate phosphoribosyltransferase [Thelocarpon impressellum]|nr:MAG: anthranilate phosphoribosyltransferase [Thelocarpon impressellum]
MSSVDNSKPQHISITPLLKRLWPDPAKANVSAAEIALAISRVFTDQLSSVQTGALLTALHFTGWDRQADVIARCAEVMRDAAMPVDKAALAEVVRKRGIKRGGYGGGLCDVVGTGGDEHSTFNISTASSILASSHLLVSKHGNRAATSKSGSADVLNSMSPTPPNIVAVNPETLRKVYEKTNYAFLFAPVFHPGMRYVATVRKELGWRTIFNLLGPLANPVEGLIEARIIGVARRDLGHTFAEALTLGGARKAMVVCGAEDLDEISCAGPTYCWRLVERPAPAVTDQVGVDVAEEHRDDEAGQLASMDIESFILSPSDFGLPAHQLSDVAPGKLPHENAEILSKILQNQLPHDDPILHFVLMNTAALFVIAGICESEGGEVIKDTGPGKGRWREGVRLAREAVESGTAWKSWTSYVDVTNSFEA